MADKPRECRARVTRVRSLAAEILEADLQMEEPPAFSFEAGQWISVPFGPKLVRAYSIASTPDRPSLITLCADVAPGGIGSRWFKSLGPGTPLTFKGPLGGFVFKRDDPRQPLFVAEEIGIVPIRSIIMTLYRRCFDRPAMLVYWARNPDWLAYHEEFLSLSRGEASFTYCPVVGEASAGWIAETGPLVAAVERHAPPVEGLVTYVAGGEEAIHRVRDVVTSRGLDRKAVKWEKFW